MYTLRFTGVLLEGARHGHGNVKNPPQICNHSSIQYLKLQI